jgi:hypothetical protein
VAARPRRGPAGRLATVLVSGLSLSGHDAADAGSSWKTELADWVHIAAASLWIGGLATLVGLVWFAAPSLRRTAFARFSRLATLLVAVVIGAGTYLSIVRLPTLSDLWTTGYGHVLLVKLGLVSLALAWGAFHHFAIRPLVARADDGVSRARQPCREPGRVSAARAAVLADSRPPQRPIGTSDRASQVPRAAANSLREDHPGVRRRRVAAAPTLKSMRRSGRTVLRARVGVWLAVPGAGDVVRIDPALGR